jgi:hypothetical protein
MYAIPSLHRSFYYLQRAWRTLVRIVVGVPASAAAPAVAVLSLPTIVVLCIPRNLKRLQRQRQSGS